MAKIYLANGESFKVVNNNSEVIGTDGTENVIIESGAQGVTVDSTVERTDLAGNVADFQFKQGFGSNIEVLDASGNVVMTLGDVNGKQLVFADGAVALTYDSTAAAVSVGGTAITTTAAAVTPATVDTNTTSQAGSSNGGNNGTGQTFALTSGADSISATAGADDTITAAGGTLGGDDIIVDGSTTDNDTLNVTTTSADMAATPTIAGIENINVNIDAFAGTAATMNATNVSGATITLSSDKLGYDGNAGVSNAKTNNVIAGTNVTALTVAGLTTGSVDAGSATDVTVNAATSGVGVTDLTVNGDINASIGATTTAKNTNITATADSVITLGAGSAFGDITDIQGSGNVTLKGAGADLTGEKISNSGTGTLSVSVTDDADADLTDVATTSATVADGYSSTLTVANESTVNAAGSLSTAEIAVAGTDTTEKVTINVAGNAVGVLNLTDIEETTLNVTQDTTIGALNAGGTQKVFVTGSGDVVAESAVTASAATVFDASGLAGKLTYTTTSGTTQTVMGGTLKSTLTSNTDDVTTFIGQDGGSAISAATTTGTLSVQTGSGVDTVNISALTNDGKVVGTLGGGDDVVTVDGIDLGTAQLTVDAGEGTDDTLKLMNSADLGTVAAASSIAGFEVVEFGTAGGTAVTVAAHLLSGSDVKIEGTTNADSLTVEGKNTAQTIDLSSLTYDLTKAVETIAITGGAGNDVITGVTGIATETIVAGGGNDTIIAGAGAGNDEITAGAGNDTIDLTGATGVNTLVWGDASGGKDTVTGWGAVDVINVESAASGDIAAEAAVTIAAQEAADDATAYILSTNGTAANLTTGGTAVVTDWTDLTEVASYLSERFTTTASTTDGVFVINDTTVDANKTYVYDYVATATVNTTVDAVELVLTGVIDNGGAILTVANVEFTA
jgi:hypothetical protein